MMIYIVNTLFYIDLWPKTGNQYFCCHKHCEHAYTGYFSIVFKKKKNLFPFNLCLHVCGEGEVVSSLFFAQFKVKDSIQFCIRHLIRKRIGKGIIVLQLINNKVEWTKRQSCKKQNIWCCFVILYFFPISSFSCFSRLLSLLFSSFFLSCCKSEKSTRYTSIILMLKLM